MLCSCDLLSNFLCHTVATIKICTMAHQTEVGWNSILYVLFEANYYNDLQKLPCSYKVIYHEIRRILFQYLAVLCSLVIQFVSSEAKPMLGPRLTRQAPTSGGWLLHTALQQTTTYLSLKFCWVIVTRDRHVQAAIDHSIINNIWIIVQKN